MCTLKNYLQQNEMLKLYAPYAAFTHAAKLGNSFLQTSGFVPGRQNR